MWSKGFVDNQVQGEPILRPNTFFFFSFFFFFYLFFFFFFFFFCFFFFFSRLRPRQSEGILSPQPPSCWQGELPIRRVQSRSFVLLYFGPPPEKSRTGFVANGTLLSGWRGFLKRAERAASRLIAV